MLRANGSPGLLTLGQITYTPSRRTRIPLWALICFAFCCILTKSEEIPLLTNYVSTYMSRPHTLSKKNILDFAKHRFVRSEQCSKVSRLNNSEANNFCNPKGCDIEFGMTTTITKQDLWSTIPYKGYRIEQATLRPCNYKRGCESSIFRSLRYLNAISRPLKCVVF